MYHFMTKDTSIAENAPMNKISLTIHSAKPIFYIILLNILYTLHYSQRAKPIVNLETALYVSL